MSVGSPTGFRCRPGDEALAARLFAQWPAPATSVAMLLIDAATVIVATNRAAETIFAAEHGELVGRPLSSIFTERDRALALDRQELAVAMRLGASEDDRWHLRCDGSTFWSLGALQTIRGADGAVEGYVKVIRDRTDLRVQMDTTIQRLAETEARLAHAKRQLATAGHELRGPLGTIAVAVHALRQAGLADEKTARMHDIVGRQMEIATRLLHDVVDRTDEEPVAPLQPERVVLQRILESAVDAVRGSPVGDKRTIELIVPSEPLELETDPVRVEQVIRNLVDNACKYNEPGGHVWITATLEGELAVVRVRDDGKGISNDLLPRIFEWFVRGDATSLSGTDGFGIGLGVVRDLVHRLHGTVEVVGAGAHGGAEFTVNLPLRPSPGEA